MFTDPDFSGEEIRRKITARFPDAKQAYLPQEEATRDGDIGVENATPEAIIRALQKVHSGTVKRTADPITMEELEQLGLSGGEGSAARREKAAAVLGIGYGNSKTFLKKVNAFGIDRAALLEALNKEGRVE